MPRSFARRFILSNALREQLETLVRAGSTPQALAFRSRIILRAAQDDRPTNLRIAEEFACNRHTVGLWRERFIEQGISGLQDAPRSGRPRTFSP